MEIQSPRSPLQFGGIRITKTPSAYGVQFFDREHPYIGEDELVLQGMGTPHTAHHSLIREVSKEALSDAHDDWNPSSRMHPEKRNAFLEKVSPLLKLAEAPESERQQFEATIRNPKTLTLQDLSANTVYSRHGKELSAEKAYTKNQAEVDRLHPINAKGYIFPIPSRPSIRSLNPQAE